jgi:hypothetical protein
VRQGRASWSRLLRVPSSDTDGLLFRIGTRMQEPRDRSAVLSELVVFDYLVERRAELLLSDPIATAARATITTNEKLRRGA